MVQKIFTNKYDCSLILKHFNLGIELKLPVVGCGDVGTVAAVGDVGAVGKILNASPRIKNEISISIDPLYYIYNKYFHISN